MNSRILVALVVASLMAMAVPSYATHPNNGYPITYWAPHTQSKVRFLAPPGDPVAGITGVNVGPGITIWCEAGGHAYTPIGSAPGTPGTPSAPPTSSFDLLDYLSWANDEVDSANDYLVEWEGFALSGEPECLPGDVATGNQGSSIGGGAAVLNGHLGQSADVVVVDMQGVAETGFTISISMSDYCSGNPDWTCSGTGTPYPDSQGDKATYCKDNEATTTPTLDGTLRSLNAPVPPAGDGRCDDLSYAECQDSVHSGFGIPGDVPDHFQDTVPPLKLMWVTVHAVFIDATSPVTNAVCLGTTGTIIISIS